MGCKSNGPGLRMLCFLKRYASRSERLAAGQENVRSPSSISSFSVSCGPSICCLTECIPSKSAISMLIADLSPFFPRKTCIGSIGSSLCYWLHWQFVQQIDIERTREHGACAGGHRISPVGPQEIHTLTDPTLHIKQWATFRGCQRGRG